MLPIAELTSQLQRLRDHGFPPPPPDLVRDLTPSMLRFVGIPEGAVRDRLIYATFVHWIELQDVYEPHQLRDILLTCTDADHLWYQITGAASDAVFTRSFSVLLIPLILIAHRKQPFLAPDEVHAVQTQLLAYLQQEHDLRGWVSPTHGWAHALAHTADALSELACCAELDGADLHAMLVAIHQTFVRLPIVLIHAEEDRFVNVLDSILERDLLADEVWVTWLDGFQQDTLRALPQDYVRCVNSKRFLESFYFYSHARDTPAALRAHLHRVIDELRQQL